MSRVLRYFEAVWRGRRRAGALRGNERLGNTEPGDGFALPLGVGPSSSPERATT